MDINTFSDEQLAGQRLMVGFDGTGFNPDLEFLINDLKVGGIVLFKGNVSTPEQIKDLCESMQGYAQSCGQPPLFIAIDQEGGQVARLGEPFTQFPGNPAIRNAKDAIRFANVTAKELGSVGINMNLAPVLDIAPEGISSVMSGRAFGHDPHQVSHMGVTVIEHLQKGQIMAVAKHFPGIGRTTLDSHLDMPRLDVEAETMKQTDLVPFQTAVEQGVSGIMVSHILYSKIDPRWPASLSPKVAGDLLRGQMGFDDIVMTDDLDMGAIKNHYDIETVIRQVLLADIDIALICHKGPNIEKAFEEILTTQKGSQAFKAKALESVHRVMALKKKFLL
ncbi:beta-N-acetylhexosaminidase [Thermodesulfobacteriota bacterium]